MLVATRWHTACCELVKIYRNERIIKVKNTARFFVFTRCMAIFADMKRLVILSALCFAFMRLAAQEGKGLTPAPDSTGVFNAATSGVVIGGGDAPTGIYAYGGYEGEVLTLADSLHLPVLNGFGQTYINMYPYDWMGCYDWRLHKGLNVNLGASVFAMFGDGPWHGAGFTQSLAAMYAVPLTSRLSLAVGGYVSNMFWAHDAYHDAGINAVLGYKFDEHWEGYLFGQKSVVHTPMPMPLYDLHSIGDRIGAAVRYNFSPSFSVQVTVSAEKR